MKTFWKGLKAGRDHSGQDVQRHLKWVKPETKCGAVFQEKVMRGLFRAPAFKRIVR